MKDNPSHTYWGTVARLNDQGLEGEGGVIPLTPPEVVGLNHPATADIRGLEGEEGG